MEGKIKGKLTTYLLDHDLINSGQLNFLQSNSCSTCVTDFVNLVTKAANDGKSVIVIFLDMANVFDHVSHRKLLVKVKSQGIKPPIWLGSPPIWSLQSRW